MRSNFSVGRAWEPLEIFKKYAVRFDYQPLFEKELVLLLPNFPLGEEGGLDSSERQKSSLLLPQVFTMEDFDKKVGEVEE